MKSRERKVVTITVYNESEVIEDVLKKIPEGIDIIVVDDGSTDGTPEIVSKFKKVKLIQHPINLGQGSAVVTSFIAAVGEDYDTIIEMDGDGQHDPLEIPKFVEALKNTDIVVGSRYKGTSYKAPLYRRIGIPFFTSIVNFVTNYKLTDSMCGFRAFKKEALEKFCYNLDQSAQYIAPEIFIKASKANLTVKEIPVNVYERSYGSSWKGAIRYGMGLIKTIIKTILE